MADATFSQNILSKYQPYISINQSYYTTFSDLITNVIFKDKDNSFSLQYKLYYGILGSSTINNLDFFELFEKKFTEINGDNSWIKEGIKCENIPKHIKLFSEMNNLLAHKPWALVWTHFLQFDNGLSYFLFQSATIMTTIHRFITIISFLELFVKNNVIKKNIFANNEKKEKIEFLKLIETEYNIKRKLNSKKDEKKENENNDEKTNAINFFSEKNKFLRKYMSNDPIIYINFDQHNDKYLYIDDFDWKTNAKYFYVDYAEKEMDFLENEFKLLDNISNNEKNYNRIFCLKDTIEKYVEIIYGINDREYDYHKTNIYLSMDLKNLIKKIACFPQNIKDENLNDLLLILNEGDLLRLIFIITAIKQKISLTYFARAFNDFSSNKNKFKYDD